MAQSSSKRKKRAKKKQKVLNARRNMPLIERQIEAKHAQTRAGNLLHGLVSTVFGPPISPVSPAMGNVSQPRPLGRRPLGRRTLPDGTDEVVTTHGTLHTKKGDRERYVKNGGVLAEVV